MPVAKAISGVMYSLAVCAAALPYAGCSARARAGTPEQQGPVTATLLSASPTVAPATQAADAPKALDDPELQAVCMPPAGWVDKGIKQGDNHIRRLWVNPAGTIGYGVVRARLPLPVGESMVLSAFISQVQQMQGKTTIVEKRSSDEGLTFVAQSPTLRYEGRVHCQGLRGWIVFASALTDRPTDTQTLKVAEAARDATVLGQ